MRQSILLLGFVILAGTSICQETMTLQKAIATGLENNFGIKIAEVNIQIAENNNTWAVAGKTPTVDLNGTFSNTLNYEGNPFSFIQGTFYSATLGANVSASYVLYDGGRIAVRKDQLSTQVQQQMLSQKTAIHDLLRSITQAYYNVIVQNQRVEVLDQNLQLSTDRLEYEETKKLYGASNSYNLLQFENAVASDQINLASQLSILEVAKRSLYTVLNLSAAADYAYTETLEVSLEQIDRAKLVATLDEENYTLKTLQMVAELNALNTELQTAQRKPTVALSGSAGYTESANKLFQDNPNTGEPFPLVWGGRANLTLGATATWNLYDGGVRQTNIQNAKLQEEVTKMSFLEARANILNQLDILIENYNNQVNLINLAEAQVNLAQSNIEMTNERFKQGQVTSLDYRNIQNQYLAALFTKVNAIYNLVITKTELDYLVGKFGE